MKEALAHLEEVAAWLKGCELHSEGLRSLGWNCCTRRDHFERVVDDLACGLVDHLQENPIDTDLEWEFVVNSQLLSFRNSAALCESKVNKLLSQSQVSVL